MVTLVYKLIKEYIQTIIDKTDQLALLGSPIDHEDLHDIITDGLGEDYRPIVERINGRDVPISLDELHEKLINRENTLSVSVVMVPTFLVTANVTHFNQQQSRSNSAPHGGYSGSQGGFKQQRLYLGRCQICGVKEHEAKRCP